jgi:hypothetical protein
MSRRRRPAPPIVSPSSSRRFPDWLWIGGILLTGVLLIAIVGYGLTTTAAREADHIQEAIESSGNCRSLPAFVGNPSFGFRSDQITASTAERDVMGFVLYDAERPEQGFQHPDGSWDDAGHLGAFAYDAVGNIYVAPTPRVSLLENPPKGSTTIWKVDSGSGHMAPYITIEAAAAPNERNPFGVMGLSYDCATNSLFVASVAGSTPSQELGRIVRIDLATKKMTTLLDGLDSIGLVIARVGGEPRLLYGLARSNEVWSVALNESGVVNGTPQFAFALDLVGATPTERVRKFDVYAGTIRMTMVPFAFTLQAGSEEQQRMATVRLRDGHWQYIP